jgi:hypothetical protein
MNTSFKTTKIGAAFLAAVLVAGTIAASSQWSMIGAQAEPYYGMDKDRKSDKKDVSVSSLKCNNINVNVNGLELDVFPPFLGGGLAAEAQEGSTDASSFGGNGGGNGGSEINDFRFICINNNNNTVVGGGDTPVPPVPPTPPVSECEECFEGLTVDLLVILETALLEGFTIGELVVPPGSTIEDLCELLDAGPPLVITGLELLGFILDFEIFAEADLFSLIAFLLCLQGLNLIDIDLFAFLDLLEQRGLVAPGAAETAPLSPPTTP